MTRRLIRRIAFSLVAMQLLLSTPVASVLAQDAVLALAGDCAGMHAEAVDAASDSNSCCPAAAMDALHCLSACTAAMAVLPTASYLLAASQAVLAETATPVLHVLPADPPLNPPPIA